MTSWRARTQCLHTAITRIVHAFHANPSTKWSEVLDQFAMVNVELLNLVDDVKSILKMYAVYPKNVNAENAPSLRIPGNQNQNQNQNQQPTILPPHHLLLLKMGDPQHIQEQMEAI